MKSKSVKILSLLFPVAFAVQPILAADLEEVIVTASKREQNLNDVGAAIAVLGAEELKAQHVVSGKDLARVTPGLSYATTVTNTPVYTLRGVGFYEQSLAAYPDVSLYLDQIPLSLPIMASKTVFDIERVEVLKGPQGTLFGNNATGGAINFIPAKPTDEFEAGINVSYGRFDTFETEGFVSGPLTDSLRARVAVRSEASDGWQKSFTRSDEIGEKDNLAGRFLLDWDASERLRFSLNINGWKDEDDPQMARVTRLDVKNPAGSAGFGGVVPVDLPVLTLPLAPSGDPRAADWSPGENRPYSDTEFWQTALRTDFDVNESMTLTSLTSYSEVEFQATHDQDGADLILFAFSDHVGEVESFTQELRLANTGESNVRWVAGVNYERTKTGESSDNLSEDSSSAPVNGAALNRYDNYQLMENYAGFANIEYDLTDQLTLKAGIRRTQAERSSNASNFTVPGRMPPAGLPYTFTEFFNLIYGFLYPGVVNTVVPGESFVLDTRTKSDGSPVDSNTYFTAGRYYGELDEGSTSWSLGINYSPADDFLLYANVSKGYKSGSFPFLAAAIFEGLEPVTQEELLSYELGFKAQFPDQALSINGTAFFYDYTDKQLLTKFVDPIFGELDRLQNVPESEVKGVELEIRAEPLDGLSVTASVSYVDTEVTEYTGVIGSVPELNGTRSPVFASFSGVELPFSSDWQYALNVNYEFSLTDRLIGFVGVGVHGQTSSYSTLAATSQAEADYELDGYTLLDLSAGIKSEDGRWEVALWGRNINDKNYDTNKFLNYDTIVEYSGRPAEYGISFGLSF